MTSDSESHVTLEDALARTGFGKFNYLLIVLTGAVLGAVFLETVSINFILPVAQCDLNMTTENKGLLSGVAFIGIIVSSHFWGFLADTRGRKTVIVPTLFVAFAVTIISSLTKSFWLLVFLRFLNGVCVAGPSSTMYAYVGEFHCLRDRSKVMMLGSTLYAVFCFWLATSATIFINQEWSYYIAPLDLEFKPWRLFMIVCGIPSILSALAMLFFMPESPKFTFSRGDEQRTLRILEKIYKWNTGKVYKVKSLVKDEEFNDGSDDKSMNPVQFMWSQTVPLFSKPHLRNILTACFIQFSIFNSSNGFWTFFPEITNKVALWMENDSHTTATVCEIMSETRTLSLNSSAVDDVCISKLEPTTFQNAYYVNFAYFFGWLFLALIINRVGKLIIITTLLFTSGLCGFSLIFNNLPTISSYTYIMLMAVGLALTVLNASTVELFPTRMRAMALSLTLMSGRLGAVFGSNFIGLMLDSHCEYTFMMPTILLITSGFLAFTIPNISNRSSK